LEDDGLATGDDHDFIGRYIDVPAAADIVGNGLAQLGQPGGGSIVRPAGVEGGGGRFNDVGWGVEIGLANFQMNDASALPFESLGLA